MAPPIPGICLIAHPTALDSAPPKSLNTSVIPFQILLNMSDIASPTQLIPLHMAFPALRAILPNPLNKSPIAPIGS